MSDAHPTEDREIWKGVVGFCAYQVSTWGRVRSFKWGRVHILRPVRRNNSYFFVVLYRKGDGRQKHSFMVHRLVLESFVGSRPEGMECRHLDGNPANNRLDNLAWGTRSENQRDRRQHGTDGRGEKCPTAKLTNADVIEIRRLWESGMTQVELGEKYSVRQTTISTICNRLTWTHI